MTVSPSERENNQYMIGQELPEPKWKLFGWRNRGRAGPIRLERHATGHAAKVQLHIVD